MAEAGRCWKSGCALPTGNRSIAPLGRRTGSSFGSITKVNGKTWGWCKTRKRGKTKCCPSCSFSVNARPVSGCFFSCVFFSCCVCLCLLVGVYLVGLVVLVVVL